MLVLTRKAQESVMVGGCPCCEEVIKVTVLEIGGGKVRLGFEAAAEVPVHRWEVWERIRTLTDRPMGIAQDPVGKDDVDERHAT